MRRVLIIIASLIVLVGAGIFVYYYFFANKPGLTVAPSSINPALPGSTSAVVDVASDAGQGPVEITTTRITERLVRISQGPVVPGEAVITVPAANATGTADVHIQYIERQSGNIFSYLVRAGKSIRISNRTLPGIVRASWLPTGKMAFVQYLSGDTLSNIETYGLFADGSGGFFLPQGLAEVHTSGVSVLTLASGANGSSAALVHSDGTHSNTVFTSPFSSLRIAFGGKNQYIAFTKPAQSIGGYLFLVDSVGRFSRLAGPLPGLVALASPSGKFVLVSYAQAGVMRLELIDTSTRLVTVLPVATIADKCVWANDDLAVYCGVPTTPSSEYSYPDDWYQGAIHFSDRIWKIDVQGRYAQLVVDFSSANVGTLDAEALALDLDETILVFVNKNDGSLWGYQF